MIRSPKQILVLLLLILVSGVLTIRLKAQILKNVNNLQLYTLSFSSDPKSELTTLIDKISLKNKENQETQLLSAIAYLNSNESDQAEDIFISRQFEGGLKQVADYWHGLVLASLGRTDESAEIWRNAGITIQLIQSAYSYELSGDFRTAQKKYESVIQIDPRNDVVWFELGKMLWNWAEQSTDLSPAEREELFIQAGDALHHAFSLDTFNPDYLNWWGYYQYLHVRNITAAIKFLEDAISRYEFPNEWAYYRLGLAYQADGKLDRALYALENANRLSQGEQVEIQKEYAKALYLSKEYERGIQVLRNALESAPERADLHYWMAILLAASCRPADGEQQAMLAKKLDPIGKFNHLAEQYSEVKDMLINCR